MARPAKQPIDSLVRRVNAIAALALACFFLTHAALGVLSARMLVSDELAFIAWGGAAVGACHMALCVFTSRSMLTDADRPPSSKKKRHLALKWVTGIALALMAACHMAAGGGKAADGDAFRTMLLIVLLAALVWHSVVGVKSLTRDLGITSRARAPMRAAAIAVGAAIAMAALL